MRETSQDPWCAWIASGFWHAVQCASSNYTSASSGSDCCYRQERAPTRHQTPHSPRLARGRHSRRKHTLAQKSPEARHPRKLGLDRPRFSSPLPLGPPSPRPHPGRRGIIATDVWSASDLASDPVPTVPTTHARWPRSGGMDRHLVANETRWRSEESAHGGEHIFRGRRIRHRGRGESRWFSEQLGPA